MAKRKRKTSKRFSSTTKLGGNPPKPVKIKVKKNVG